ncbi:MAG: siphovirus Gp157 family protein [Fimbriimonadaceae bacterium]|nr:siphovirus Gp157 family protein [Fimbriimonadaceae bacterium]
MKLWEIDGRIAELERAMADLEGEDESILRAFEQELDRAEEQLTSKIDSIAALISSLEATAKARKEEADRLAKLAKSDLNRAQRVREFLLGYLRSRGVDRMDTPRYRLSVAANGGLAPIRISLPADELPEEYRRTQYTADLDAIRNALERGEQLQWAMVGERGVSLRIR